MAALLIVLMPVNNDLKPLCTKNIQSALNLKKDDIKILPATVDKYTFH